LRREADRLLFREADERVGLVDGAVWIREQMQLHLAELDGLGLDFYHLSENVHRARRKAFGEGSPEGMAWAEKLMHGFKHDGYAATWQTLVQWRALLRGKAKREAADRLLKSAVRPSKQLMKLAANEIKDREQFTLLAEQRLAYEIVLHVVDKAQRSDAKEVVIITGGPGSGKSVIALSLLGELYRQGSWANYWSATEVTTTNGRFLHFAAGAGSISPKASASKNYAFALRCVR
jgi:chromosomal replication initiation ATPase DnaA